MKNMEENQPVDYNSIRTTPIDAARADTTSSRRALIEQYVKVAVVAAPLLVFVSKARAIHSKP
jgi:hypothetical protein